MAEISIFIYVAIGWAPRRGMMYGGMPLYCSMEQVYYDVACFVCFKNDGVVMGIGLFAYCVYAGMCFKSNTISTK